MKRDGSIMGGLVLWIVVGSVLQVAMVVAGHFAEGVRPLYPVIGVSISALAGALFGARGARGAGESAWGGALAGALCPVVGVLVSVALGQVGMVVLAIAMGSGVVTGAIGGLLGFGAVGRRG